MWLVYFICFVFQGYFNVWAIKNKGRVIVWNMVGECGYVGLFGKGDVVQFVYDEGAKQDVEEGGGGNVDVI